jgi:hypothetical protein
MKHAKCDREVERGEQKKRSQESVKRQIIKV